MQRRVRRVRFDRQLIERQVIARQIQRFRKFRAPRIRRLIGPRVNQVEGKPIERRARDIERRLRFRNAVNASELAQLIVAQRLHADRDAIDARFAKTAKPRRLDTVRIGFERDLGIGRDSPALRDVIENGCRRRRLHERRRTAPEKNARNRPRADQIHRRVDLANVGSEKSSFVPTAETNVAIEIAIRAFLRAERPVRINPERRSIISQPRRLRVSSHARGKG